MTDQTQSSAPGQSPCACWPGRLCDRSAKCSAEAMVRATPAPAPADHATVEQWEAALTTVMPADLKCWHENSRREWPEVAVWVIEGLRQSRDEAWATVERLTATAPAPAAPTLPAHQRTAPARIYLHDGDDEHTEPFPAGMDDGVTWSSDNATGLGVPYVRADLIRSSVAEDRQETIIGHSVERGGWCVYSHYHGGDYTFEMGPFATRGGAEAAVRAPQAPQQAECPECIEQARLLGAGSEREAALTAEIEQLRRANEQYGQRERWWNDKMVDLEQQVASHSAGIARLQQICTSIHDGLLRGDDDRDLLDLAAQAWDGGPAPQQAELTDEQIYAVDRQVMEGAQTGGYILALCRAVIAEDRALRTPGMTDAIHQAVAAERERCAKIVDVPADVEPWEVIGSQEGADMLRELAAKIRAGSDTQVTSTGWDKP